MSLGEYTDGRIEDMPRGDGLFTESLAAALVQTTPDAEEGAQALPREGRAEVPLTDLDGSEDVDDRVERPVAGERRARGSVTGTHRS
jgi:hypothetical protein